MSCGILPFKRNSTIVAIAVHPKLNPGDVYYNADDFGERITIMSRPYWRSYEILRSGAWWVSYQRGEDAYYEESLGDCGFPGFAYDDRPFRWVRTEAEVAKRATEIENWHINQDMIDPPHYDYDY